MQISPYVSFNGNCAEAVAFYEKVFFTKAEIIRYKDAPFETACFSSKEIENLVMFAQFTIDGEEIMLCDTLPGYPVTVGGNIIIMVKFNSFIAAKLIFDAIKEGGTINTELQDLLDGNCFGSVTDKFGINWYVSIGCPTE